MVSEIHSLLWKSKKKVQFVWKRRDHRFLTLADHYSKLYLKPQRLTAEYRSAFPEPQWYHLDLKDTFRISPGITDVRSKLFFGKRNFLILPHQVVLLNSWIGVLRKVQKTKCRWVALVPPLWSTKDLWRFVANYGIKEVPASEVFESVPPSFLKKSLWLCSNFRGEVP